MARTTGATSTSSGTTRRRSSRVSRSSPHGGSSLRLGTAGLSGAGSSRPRIAVSARSGAPALDQPPAHPRAAQRRQAVGSWRTRHQVVANKLSQYLEPKPPAAATAVQLREITIEPRDEAEKI